MNEILLEAQGRGITRLCHFTKSANLAHILATGEIRNAASLRGSVEGFRPTDVVRLDGHPDHINCSLEYPNTWYLDKASRDDPHFRDWVVLDLDITLLAREGAKFCPFNAARNNGGWIGSGLAAFTGMFNPRVVGNAARARDALHPSWWPTDDQAEVLLPGAIPVSQIRAIIVKTDEQAELEYYRLTQHLEMGAVLPPIVVAPMLFDKYGLSRSVRNGRRPVERPYRP
ncbi:DarT ssDNA thymidine ADP-ribosyltransferase family protein [Streptomyces sp. NPDC012637]|uniref:DarT ssDNA thymidine ADP-ribosyltransferase family protein n=1 Tax=Streptomyces sp. NPDC012637 TaxID=3364842 RepID=UPI0036E580A7